MTKSETRTEKIPLDVVSWQMQETRSTALWKRAGKPASLRALRDNSLSKPQKNNKTLTNLLLVIGVGPGRTRDFHLLSAVGYRKQVHNDAVNQLPPPVAGFKADQTTALRVSATRLSRDTCKDKRANCTNKTENNGLDVSGKAGWIIRKLVLVILWTQLVKGSFM